MAEVKWGATDWPGRNEEVVRHPADDSEHLEFSFGFESEKEEGLTFTITGKECSMWSWSSQRKRKLVIEQFPRAPLRGNKLVIREEL